MKMPGYLPGPQKHSPTITIKHEMPLWRIAKARMVPGRRMDIGPENAAFIQRAPETICQCELPMSRF